MNAAVLDDVRPTVAEVFFVDAQQVSADRWTNETPERTMVAARDAILPSLVILKWLRSLVCDTIGKLDCDDRSTSVVPNRLV